MAVDHHFCFVVSLALLFFCRESVNGGPCTLRCHCLFDSGREVGALDFLFLGGRGSCEQQFADRNCYEQTCLHVSS